MVFEMNGETIEIKEDFMSHVYRNGLLIGPFRSVFPNHRINFDCGYVVKPDNTIVCSMGASWWISQFDGCLENEINMNI